MPQRGLRSAITIYKHEIIKILPHSSQRVKERKMKNKKITFQLEKSIYSSGKISDNKKESDNYKGLNLHQIGEIFSYLQSVAYNYPIDKPPKMDRTIFSTRSLKIKNDNTK